MNQWTAKTFIAAKRHSNGVCGGAVLQPHSFRCSGEVGWRAASRYEVLMGPNGADAAMHAAISTKREEIAALCRRGLARLEVFGSAARGEDFDSERSDADFMLRFSPDGSLSLCPAIFWSCQGIARFWTAT